MRDLKSYIGMLAVLALFVLASAVDPILSAVGL